MAEEQNEYGLPTNKGEKRRTARLLPRYYRTESNKKFIQATLDQLTQSGTVKKLNGYIGRQNAKAVTGTDVFIDAVTTDRQDYQLEPSAVVKDKLDNVTFFKDYIDYVNTVDVLGGISKNHKKLNEQEFYSWNPHVSWDKLVNFQQYYWLPYGPSVVNIPGQQKAVISTYKVVVVDEEDNRAFLFTPNGLTRNPTLKLYRGQTYHFEIDSLQEPFSIKTQRVSGNLFRYTSGVSTNAVGVGTITFTVPENSPNVLYYVSENSADTGGVFEIFDITENTVIDVEAEVLKKKTYRLASGLELSNGMKVTFSGEVSPAVYSKGAFYVEGVGSEIKLIPENDLEIITGYSEATAVLFDDGGFDTLPFSNATAYAGKKDYITINRSNIDGNPWSRYNRWFHQDVITKSSAANGLDPVLDQAQRATRPIIEFESNLKLFNFGTVKKSDVDLIDNYTQDVFSTIEGSLGYTIDNVPLVQGHRVLFTADTDVLANNRIFKVDFITVHEAGKNPVRQIHLVEETDTDPIENQTVLIRSGTRNQGKNYWFNGTTWKLAQEKPNVNQSPLFDLYDSDEVSISDVTKYPGSTFTGNKIFSYKVGPGTADSVLGFALTYKNINNIGDIVFNFDLLQNSFSYKEGVNVITSNTDSKFLKVVVDLTTNTFDNGWTKNLISNVQPVIRIFKDVGGTVFPVDVYNDIGQLSDLEVRVYIDGKRLDKSLWTLTDGSKYKQVVLKTAAAVDTVVTLKCFSNQDKNQRGHYEFPINFQNNPLNQNIDTFTLGEAIDHVDSIIDNTATFIGSYPGPGNLRDLGNLSHYGTKFVQHSGPLNVGLYHLTSKNANVIKALKQARDEYGKFKRNFINLATSLEQVGNIKTFVDNILFEHNKDKSKSTPYYFSDMIGYGASTKTDYTVVDYRIKTYPLTEIFSLDTLSNKAVNVYVNDVQVLYGNDYTFNSTGFVEFTNTYALQDNDVITVYEYESTDGCFVPATPTSIGMWPKYEPKKYLDTTLITPQYVIQGHDGSVVLAYNDYRDDLILDIEKRIFNNIKVNYNPEIFDILDFIPGYNRNTPYSLNEFNQILAPNFYQWTALIDRDFTKPLTYTPENLFTYNYRKNTAPDGRDIPAYWRGIYSWIFDTDRIHICPWESLGFSIKPKWWETVYGPAPYTSDNLLLWADLKDGIIREPNKLIFRNEKFARPILATQVPVDENGALLNPVAANIVQGFINLQGANDDYVFGDLSPVENAWKRSSFYPFSVILAATLMQPNKVLGTCLDRSRIIKNKNNQLIYKETGLRLQLEDLIIPSIPSENARIQTAGLINYIVDYILSDNLKSLNEYKYDLQYLNNHLSHRLGGFTSKDKLNLILDSKSPSAISGVFVPKENYSIFLNTSSPTKKLNYSGVIVTKVLTRSGIGYEVKGYSQTQPFFYYYPWVQPGNDINVGGISESYTDWTSGQVYIAGNIVQYNNIYYRVKSNHTAQTNFDSTLYQKLAVLPIIGGRNANLRKAWDRVPNIVNYGITYSSIQEVVDFLQGYGEYLKDQGFVFDDYNTNLKAVASWETSVKEFLFWTTQNWSAGEQKYKEWNQQTEYTADQVVLYNGDFYKSIRDHQTSNVFQAGLYTKLDGLSQDGASVIALSPAALGLSMNVPYNVIDDIRDRFNEYEIFKADGLKFDQNFLNYTRENNLFSFSPRVNGVGIYGAGLFLVQKEHVLILDNATQFNDTIYNAPAGYKQDRIKVSGYKTIDWYGGFDIPGFIFDQAKISNWEPWVDYNLGDIVKYKEFYYSAEKFLPGVEEFNSGNWVKLANKPTSELLPNWDYKAEQFTDFYDLESDNFDSQQQKIAQHLIGYQKRQYLENIIKNDVSEYKFFQGMLPEKGSVNVLNKLFDVLSANDAESIDFNEEWAVRVGQYGGADAFDEIEISLNEQLFKTNPQAFELVNVVDQTLVDFVIRQTPSQIYVKPSGYNNSPWPVNTSFTPYLRTPGFVKYDQVSINVDSLSNVIGKDITTFTEGDYVWCAFQDRSWQVYRFTKAEFFAEDISYSNKVLTLDFDRIPDLAVGDIIGIVNSSQIQGFHKISSLELSVATIDLEIKDWKTPFQDSAQVLFYKFTSQRAPSIDSNFNLPKTLKTNELLWTDDNGAGKNAVWQNTPVYEKKTLADTFAETAERFGRILATNTSASVLLTSTDNNEVYVYKTSLVSTTGWVKSQTLANSTITGFGSTLAVSPDGEWIAIASPTHNSGQGVVLMYSADVNGNYQYVSTLTSPNAGNNQQYGSKIKIASTSIGYRMIVSQPAYNSSQGRLYSYTGTTTDGSTTAWTLEGAIETVTTVGDNFGYDFDITPDSSTLVVSAPNANAYAGKVYVYNHTSSLYELAQTLTSGASNPERYGESVAVTTSGDTIAVGSILYDGTQADQGLVRLYKLAVGTYTADQLIKNRNPETAEAFGARVQFINNDKSLVIFSTLGDSITLTSFDTNSTLFDSGATRIATVNKDIGRFDVYDKYNTQFLFAESLPLNNASTDKYGYAFAAGNNTIITSAPFATYNSINSGLIYTYVKSENAYSWQQIQVEADVVDLRKIKKVFLYNKKTNALVTYLDVIDPIQGKIAGIAEQEIKFKTYYDPATYSVGTNTVNVDDGMAWTSNQVGMLWWNMTNAKFLDSYIGDVVYKNSTWNTLYDSASIDIYEWVESKLTPTEWDKQADTEAGITLGISGTSLYGNSVYSVKKRYDTISKSFKNTYYFWVKNKTIVPNVVDRAISAKDVANLISDPKSYGHKFIEFTSDNSFSLVNIETLLQNSDIVLAVQYWLVDSDDLNIHTEWKLISEHPNTVIPSAIEKKWVDSLVGADDNNRIVPDFNLPVKQKYGIQFRPRQSMFVNRLEALKQYIERLNSELGKVLIADSADLTDFNSYEESPSTIVGSYDFVVDTYEELRLINTGAVVKASVTPVIVDGRIVDIVITNAGSGYVYAPEINISGSGSGANIKTIINDTGSITSAIIANGGNNYSNSTTLSIRPLSVLVKSDANALNRWSIYAYDTSTSVWSRTKSQAYNVQDFWDYIDWYDTGYNQFSKIDYVVDGTYQLFSLSTSIGQTVKVKTVGSAGWMLLEKYANVDSIDYTQSYKVIGRQNGTIAISNKFYQFSTTSSGFDGPLYDADPFDNSGASELKIILNAVKNKILIDDLKPVYLQLFFASLRYALSEQTFVDWAFKTSFVKAMHNVGKLEQRVTYANDNLQDFEQYIAEVKPYRTKIREYVSSYNTIDNTQTMVTDFDIPSVGRGNTTQSLPVKLINGEIQFVDSEITEYPWKNWLDNVGFKIKTIEVVDGGSGYISKPVVNITGDATTKATARAYISNGKVIKVEVVTSGAGYLKAPTIELVGGTNVNGVQARAIAVIKNDLVRSNLIKIKFDRTTQNYFITELDVTEQFTGTGSKLQWALKWSPDLTTGKTIVTINGQEALRDTYSVTSKKSTSRGYTSYSGLLTFTSSPASGDVIVIKYVKDFNYLNAADRINFYYNPVTGQLGKDLTQLMTGIDYGGVNIVGLDFKSSAGWDVLPWFNDVWDGFDPTFDDYIITVGDSTYSYDLPYTPTAGQQINVYVNGVRIDDLYYGLYDGSTEQPNGRFVAPENAIMRTFVGNGINNIITLPNLTDNPALNINDGDQVIFRKSTSDGANTPSALDYDTALSGGNLAYTTATGLAAEDIIVDGDGFVTPSTSPAPEEVVPGQITDALAVKVFQRPTNGSADVKSNNYVADGIKTSFALGQTPNTSSAVVVKINNQITTNFTIDYDLQTVKFATAPADKAIVSVTSFGYNGTDILDLDYFIGDGSSIEFITTAPWTETLSSLVVVSGALENYNLFRTDATYDSVDRVGIRFGSAPTTGQIINYLISNTDVTQYSLASKETFVTDGINSTYLLNNSIGDAFPQEPNVIVRTGNTILASPNYTYFTLANNVLSYTIPSYKYRSSLTIDSFKIYLAGYEISIMTDYTIDLSTGTITLNELSYSEGKLLVIGIVDTADYFIDTDSTQPSIVFTSTPASNLTYEITSFSNHNILDIQRSESEISLNVSVVQNSVDYFKYNEIVGGTLELGRETRTSDHVWVIKNNTLLTHSIDYKLNPNKTSIKLAVDPVLNDNFVIMTFASQVVESKIGYMQFKDMLNRTHYKRLAKDKQTLLINDLNYYDSTIVVEDGTVLAEPNRSRNLPGILYINGERVEYYLKDGNTLTQLRRGTLGTGTPSKHPAGEFVLDIGISETIPYNDDVLIETYLHDGSSNVIPLPYIPNPTAGTINDGSTVYTTWLRDTIPAQYGQCDEIDVFVGGWNILGNWTDSTGYSIGDIVMYGSYTYKCVTAHTSSTSFTADKAKWKFFVGNQRLKKHPYSVHNVDNHYESTEADVNFEADFSVNGTTAGVRLTNDLTAGTKVIVTKKIGRVWNDIGKTLTESDNKIANFLKEKTTIWPR